MNRKKAFLILSFFLLLIMLNWLNVLNSFLSLLALVVAPIILYIIKYILDEYKNAFLGKIAEYLKIKLGFPSKREENEVKNIPPKVGIGLDILEKKVATICRNNLAMIQESKISLIEELNWKFNPGSSDETKHTGDTIEVVTRTKEDPYKSVAILGEGGTGKTYVLFRYILYLIDNHQFRKVPVYLPLSSWSKDQSLKDWLEAELTRVYYVPKSIAKNIVSNCLIMPFLDGIDQIDTIYRQKVIEEIYKYASESDQVVITCRPQIFDVLTSTLPKTIDLIQFFSIYELLPLRTKQVFKAIKDPIIRVLVENLTKDNKEIESIVRYPMVLYIITLIVKDIQRDELKALNHDELFSKLWKKYEDHIFKEKHFSGEEVHYHQTKVQFFLQQLCDTLKNGGLFVAGLQPAFLSKKEDRFLYYLLSRIFCAMALSISIGWFLSGPLDYIGTGIVAGCVVTVVLFVKRNLRSNKITSKFYFHRGKNITNCLVFGVPVAIALTIYLGFTTPRWPIDMAGNYAKTEINIGFFMSFFFGTIFGLRDIWQKKDFDIKPVVEIKYDFKNFLDFGLKGGLIVGSILVLLAVITGNFYEGNTTFFKWAENNYYDINIVLFASLAGIAFGFLFIGLLGILKEGSSEDIKKLKANLFPNRGIKSLIKNTMKAGLIAGVPMILAFSLFFGLLTGEFTSVVKAVKAGIGGGLFASLWFGGFDLIQHYTLRLLIYLRKYGPWSFTHFLEYSSSLRFTRVIGGGYEFMHSTLGDFFTPIRYERSELKHEVPFYYVLLPITFFILLSLALLPFYYRYLSDPFWKNAYGFQFDDIPSYVERYEQDKLIINNIDQMSDTIEIIAEGKARVGAFTGYTSPGGTEAGFLGFSVEDVYDYDSVQTSRFAHSALLVKRINKDTGWISFPGENLYNFFNSKKRLRLAVDNGDTLQFLVNDNEWQNNLGRYQIDIKKMNGYNTKIISHRGAAGLAPENTIKGIKQAISLNVDLIEVDVRQTKDNILVLMHDASVNRTTNGTGKISDLTWSEIERMNIKSDTKLSVPKLNSALSLIKNSSSILLIEVKDPSHYTGIARRLAQTVHEQKLENQVIIFSFDKKFIENFNRDYPEFQVGIFVLFPFDKKKMEGINFIGVHYLSLLLYPPMIRDLQEKKYQVFAWNVNFPTIMQTFLDKRIDGIITDYPDKLNKTISH